MRTRQSKFRAAAVFSAVIAQTIAAGSIAAADCAQLAAIHINEFFGTRMESMDVEDTVKNPCSGSRELGVVEIRPGFGFVMTFVSGDQHAEVDPHIATLCEDGRAMLKNAATGKLICDTR